MLKTTHNNWGKKYEVNLFKNKFENVNFLIEQFELFTGRWDAVEDAV